MKAERSNGISNWTLRECAELDIVAPGPAQMTATASGRAPAARMHGRGPRWKRTNRHGSADEEDGQKNAEDISHTSPALQVKLPS